jgi:hypothetical protein
LRIALVVARAVTADDATRDSQTVLTGERDGVASAGAPAVPHREQSVSAADHGQVAQHTGLAAMRLPIGRDGLDRPPRLPQPCSEDAVDAGGITVQHQARAAAECVDQLRQGVAGRSADPMRVGQAA